MKSIFEILKSCFGQKEKGFSDELLYITKTNNKFKVKGVEIDLLGKNLYLRCLEYMTDTFESANVLPSEDYFLSEFPDIPKEEFENLTVLTEVGDFRVGVRDFMRKLINKKVSKRMAHLSASINSPDGFTQKIADEMAALQKLLSQYKVPEIQIDPDMAAVYYEKVKLPSGMKTGIRKLDELIGGMEYGTVSVIAGYTSHFKTVFAVNVAHLNSYNSGYNIAYLSLETPKEIMYNQLLSLHSYDAKFTKCQFIPHDKIRKCELTDEECDYLFNVVQPDLRSKYVDGEGKEFNRGKVVFFDLSDFDTFSFSEISNTLEALDDKLNGNLDAVIVDYVQLCKFVENLTIDDNKMINSYVAYFRRLAQDFYSNGKKKKLIVILLSQINRESWKRVRNKKYGEGRYDLTCLADANELERGSSRVFTVYTSENMKLVKEAQVQLLKNRNGVTMWDPEKVFVDPEAYVFGEEFDMLGQPLGGSISQNAISESLSILDNLDSSNGLW
jgi:replicative DNA helicase